MSKWHFLNIFFFLLMLTGLNISQVNVQDLEIVSVRSSNQLPGMVIGHFFFYFLGGSMSHLKKYGRLI